MKPEVDNDRRCPVCGHAGYHTFHRVNRIPVHVGILWPTKDAAQKCPRGDVSLSYCSECGFIGNSSYQVELVNYSLTYDNALHFSGVFQAYENELAGRLYRRYSLQGKRVMEIGCGSGHFLGLLCDLGAGGGIGFDPSHDPLKVDSKAKGRAEFVRDYFSEQYADVEADFICCRHVLEHIADPVSFLSMIRIALEDRPATTLYFEVPNARLILDHLSIWDIMYEHCDYFTVESLRYLFEFCGFEVLELQESYNQQFLSIEAHPVSSRGKAKGGELGDLSRLVSSFAGRFEKRCDKWQAFFAAINPDDARVVVWGGGGKAVSFLNMFAIARDIEFVVDVNPAKHGTFLAGSGHKIVAPRHLKSAQPHTVVVMNPAYTEEIRRNLDDMGLRPAVVNAS